MSPGEWKAKGGGLTIRYGFHTSPFGLALVMVTDRGLAGCAFADPGEERACFEDMAGRVGGGAARTDSDQIEMRVLIPAFMISELMRGFEIGFLIVLPFLVIDMIVATLTMSMGMMMLPPTVISLPFKVLFFVLIDGWNLLVGGLMRLFL